MFYQSKLKNGITLITVPVKGTKATTILAMFPVGSRYETKDFSGASHFVEHMMFKGTDKRPEATDISRALEAVGADYNAFTNKDYTGYYVKIDSAQQVIAFDLLSDMVYHSKLEAAEIEKEKGTIVEELRMYMDNPLMAIDIYFDRITFGDHPLGWDIGGSEQTVRALTREMLYKYYQTHYSPKNMVLVVSGNTNSQQVKKYIKYFAGKVAPKNSKTFSFYKNGFVKYDWAKTPPSLNDRVFVKEDKVDQVQMILGFPGLHNNHPDKYAASLLLNILGAGMSSRLFVEVREKRGLAYMVRAGASGMRDVGVAYVQAGLDPARLSEAVAVIKTEVMRMTTEPVTAQELRDAKTAITGRMALNMEDSSAQAEWYAKQFIFNTKIETPEQVLTKLKKVTVADVKRIAKKLFVWKELRLALIGPVSKSNVLKMLS